MDIDSDSVTYGFSVRTGNLEIIAFADTGATSSELSYQWMAEAMDIAGVDQVSGKWSILATDGQDTTLASNGPRFLTVDASMVGVEDNAGVPERFALQQNYPNPFNPTTTINYAVPKQAFVNIIVYDILGNKVHTLVKAEKSAGRYSVQWDGTNQYGKRISTGMYWYRMNTSDYQSVRKMVFMK